MTFKITQVSFFVTTSQKYMVFVCFLGIYSVCFMPLPCFPTQVCFPVTTMIWVAYYFLLSIPLIFLDFFPCYHGCAVHYETIFSRYFLAYTRSNFRLLNLSSFLHGIYRRKPNFFLGVKISFDNLSCFFDLTFSGQQQWHNCQLSVNTNNRFTVFCLIIHFQCKMMSLK